MFNLLFNDIIGEFYLIILDIIIHRTIFASSAENAVILLIEQVI